MIRRFDCDAFLDALDALVEGSASPRLRSAADAHARGCPDCEALRVAALEPLVPDAASGDAPDLTEAVLARTGSDPCARAADLLGADAPVAGDRDLLERHLAHCRSCDALGRALVRLARELPALAVPEGAPDLVPAVLRRTLPLPIRIARAIRPAIETARALARRPRFALEASYAALILFLVLFGVPESVPALIPSNAHVEVKQTATLAGDWIASGAKRFARTSGTLARDLTGLLQPDDDSDDDTRSEDADPSALSPGDDHERN